MKIHSCDVALREVKIVSRRMDKFDQQRLLEMFDENDKRSLAWPGWPHSTYPRMPLLLS